MPYFAQTDSDGLIVAFYNDLIHGGDIPEVATPITDEQWSLMAQEPWRWALEGRVFKKRPFIVPTINAGAIADAIQAHLDTTARERKYNSIQSAITYRGDTNPQFAAEADALFEWRSAVWTYATEQLAAVEAGEREAPETAEAFIEELPPFKWPVLEPLEV